MRKVKLTPAQDAALQLRARQLRVSVPRLLVESALADQETATDRREVIETLFRLQRLLSNVANNVNQLARKANVDDEFPEAARPVLDHVMRVAYRIGQTVDEIGTPGGRQGGGAR